MTTELLISALERLRERTARQGYYVGYADTNRRGKPSAKPWKLYLFPDGRDLHWLASFATHAQLERNFDARAGN